MSIEMVIFSIIILSIMLVWWLIETVTNLKKPVEDENEQEYEELINNLYAYVHMKNKQ